MNDRLVVTEDHIKLLRNAWVRWEDIEYGAPAINPKRPYGNSDVDRDIAELLGWDFDMENRPDEAQCRAAYQLHRALEDVLQIVLSTGSFEPGEYVRVYRYGNEWRRA